MNKPKVLISGASFAGLATAFWMKRAGYAVTIVEVATEIRKGGTPVNIKGDTLGILERMGVLDKIVANRIETNRLELWGPEGPISPEPAMTVEGDDGDAGEVEEYEIERDALTDILLSLVKDDVEIIFGDSLASMNEVPDNIQVSFNKNDSQTFDFVFGCDGLHSNTRKLWFGEEATFAHFLGAYGSVSIAPRLLAEEGTTAIYQAPGRVVVMTGYHQKTDIIALFSSDRLIDFDRKDSGKQKTVVTDNLVGEGWRIPELIGEIERADYFWFSDLSQIRMPSWFKGRVCLVGDAAYCPSPAAGMGGSLAINGAAALGNAFAANPVDYAAAFRAYDKAFRPIVNKIHGQAMEFCRGVSIGKIA